MEASPEEIIRMGAATSLNGSDLRVEFADVAKKQSLGSQTKIESTFVTVKEENDLPDFEPQSSGGFYFPNPMHRPNVDYYREFVGFIKQSMLLRKITLTVTNAGTLSAQKIRVEFKVHDPERQWEFRDSYSYEERPPQRYNNDLLMRSIKPAAVFRGPSCDIEYSDGSWHLNFDFQDLQPQRTLRPGVEFYAGCRRSGPLVLGGRVFAAELPGGGQCELTLTAETKSIETDLDAVEKFYKGQTDADD